MRDVNKHHFHITTNTEHFYQKLNLWCYS